MKQMTESIRDRFLKLGIDVPYGGHRKQAR